MAETATEKLQALESEPSSDAMREKLRKEKYDNARLRLKPLSSFVVCLLFHVLFLPKWTC